jgi:hypothetical protein
MFQRIANGLKKFRLVNWFHEIGGDSEFPAASRVSSPPRGRKQHDCRIHQLRILSYLLGERKTVHFLHLAVEQNQREWMTGGLGRLESVKSGLPALD